MNKPALSPSTIATAVDQAGFLEITIPPVAMPTKPTMIDRNIMTIPAAMSQVR